MVREVIEQANRQHQQLPVLPIREVRAKQGKVARAEPVSALYEQGRVHHVGNFGQLEDQMCNFTIDFDPKTAGYSPDRLDAMVYAMHELIVSAGTPGVIMAGQQAASAAAGAADPRGARQAGQGGTR